MDVGAEAYNRFLSGDDYGLEQVIGLYKDSLIFFLLQYVKRIWQRSLPRTFLWRWR